MNPFFFYNSRTSVKGCKDKVLSSFYQAICEQKKLILVLYYAFEFREKYIYFKTDHIYFQLLYAHNKRNKNKY